MEKQSFIYYYQWAEELLLLPDDLRLKIDDAVKRYVLYGEEPKDRDVIYSMFGIMRNQLEKDGKKWERIKNERSKAGVEGMKKRWGDNKNNKNNKCYQDITKITNITVNDNVNVNDNNKETLSIESTKKDGLSLVTPTRFDKFREVLKNGCPYIAAMPQQMTEAEFEKVLKLFGGDAKKMLDGLKALDNNKRATKNNRSVYQTVLSWHRKGHFKEIIQNG